MAIGYTKPLEILSMLCVAADGVAVVNRFIMPVALKKQLR